jgi:hypothetical protein
MANFITGKVLNERIYDIIWEAEKQLLVVSPFIKLDAYFKEIFSKHLNNHLLEIKIIFGKNESTPNKSLRKGDFDFFKQFPNITISYCKDLHGKFYANEKEGVITSINLYDHSFRNNIEFGFHQTTGFFDNLKQSVGVQAWDFCNELIYKTPAVFVKRPVYDTKQSLFGTLLNNKHYLKSEILYDATSELISINKFVANKNHKFYNEFPNELDSRNTGIKKLHL